MRLKLLTISLITPLLLLPAALPLAAQSPKDKVCEQVSQIDPDCQTGGDRIFGPDGLIEDIINVLTFVIGVVAVIIIIVAGLMYVLSGGDPNNTKRAKDAIIYSVVGLIVAVMARLIVNFVISRIG